MTAGECLESALLSELGIRHGFGLRGSTPPAGVVLPRQVHGVAVAKVDASGQAEPEAADAIVSTHPGQAIAVVTADCVPILVAAAGGGGVAAIHAGWRGLAAGVIEAGILGLQATAPSVTGLVAAIGPHIGACCYEVDSPVLDPLTRRFGAAKVQQSQRATRPGHARIALAPLVLLALEEAGVRADRVELIEDACTACDPDRFDSFRRDGNQAGRMVHWVAAR